MVSYSCYFERNQSREALMYSLVENVIATIIVTLVSTAAGLILQAYGFSTQISIIVALFSLLVLLFLFLAFRRYYPIYIRRLTERLLENALRVNKNESDEARIEFRKTIVERVLRESSGVQPKENTWIREFENQEVCEPYLKDEFRNARKVKILTIRGEKYFGDRRSLFYNLYLEKRAKKITIKVLVLSPESNHITDELAEEMSQHSAKAIRRKMEIVLDSLKSLAVEDKNFEVRCYDETPNFKLLLFDDVMFVSAFTEPKNDHNAKMLRITREGTPLFVGLEKHFDDLWQHSIPIE
jgi:hypothetical protein